MNKRTDRLKCRDRIVIEQKMRCRGNFDHVNVAIAKPREVGKRPVLLAIQKELWHPKREEFLEQLPGVRFLHGLEAVCMVGANINVQRHVVSDDLVSKEVRRSQFAYHLV